jgi:hypothetical protein
MLEVKMDIRQETNKRTKTGRSKIDNMDRTNSFSRRAMNGKLNVIRDTCPYCHHSKIFAKPSGHYCCKCGMKIETKSRIKKVK